MILVMVIIVRFVGRMRREEMECWGTSLVPDKCSRNEMEGTPLGVRGTWPWRPCPPWGGRGTLPGHPLSHPMRSACLYPVCGHTELVPQQG